MVRIKNRYLLLNILYPDSNTTSKAEPPATLSFQAPTPDYVDAGRFLAHLRAHISLLFGDFGLGVSLSSLKVVYFSTATSTAIIRVPRNHHRLVWAALSHITELPGPRKGGGGAKCVVRVVRVSGTIRKAEEELLRRAKRDVVRAKLAQDGKQLPWVTGVADRSAKGKAREDPNVSMQSIEDLSGEEEEESD
ncbi:RNA-binding protein pop5 [Knufia obscura]|uniref:RNA-binding protein pop5 n=2 Tax=Knufia TaxID=430999 RepID=A0AAN8EXH1_9EURO|nr:RNA-binding protein pop5 [Knufia obscura]KAK5955801.1 RNA-binding protein pop5 [Knufia fluminis]